MKGDLHTDELMHAVVASETGLRTARQISHVYLMDVPDYPRPLLLTDVAINISADAGGEGRHRAERDRSRACHRHCATARRHPRRGRDRQRPACPRRSTPRRCARWPSAGRSSAAWWTAHSRFDNAINEAAAAEKHIVSPVAGRADILVVPDLEAGNMLAKQLTFLSGAEAAGVVLGARVPIILTSRADSAPTRLASCALGVLVVRARAAA